MNEIIYQKIHELLKKGESAALCTIINSTGSAPRHEGTKMLVMRDGMIIGTVGGGEMEERVSSEALSSLDDLKVKILKYSLIDPNAGDPGVCGGTVEVLIEPITPNAHMIIIGGGHVGKAVIKLAKFLGFRVGISDDRKELCTKDEHPDADEFYPVPMQELPNVTTITPTTYIILTTRGSDIDVEGLAPLLNTQAAFIGVLGSKRRWLSTEKALLENGVDPAKLAKVHSPLGLELNAETPEEIAVSIMSEIIMIRNNGTGQSMKLK